VPLIARLGTSTAQLIGILLAKLAAPLADRFIRHDDPTSEQEVFHVMIAKTEAEVQPDTMADDFNEKTMMLVMLSEGWCIHETNIAPQTTVVQGK
jgi:hypothetical protein